MLPTLALSALLLAPFASALPRSGSITWGSCGAQDPAGLSCGNLSVPINWDDPSGEHITLFMARLSAKNSSSKIGSLIFNPGGPGTPASTYLIALAQYGVAVFPDEFDIIGPDPRGVGRSNPIQCDPTIWNERVSYQPTDESSFQQLVNKNRALGASCRQLTGALIGYIDSASVAKDFEAIRCALGDEKLNYLGFSYGTVIGQAYAELYPENIRVMALDGNLDHSLSETSSLADEAYAYENELHRFSTWCAATSSCPLHGQDVLNVFRTVTTKADQAPIPAPGCQTSGLCRPNVTGEEIRFNFQDMLGFKNAAPSFGLGGWADAASALQMASQGNATALSTPLAKSSSDPAIVTNGIAQLCLDWNHYSYSLADVTYKEQMTNDIAPYTRGASTSAYLQSACIGWPEPVQYKPAATYIDRTPPIFLTNAYHDPETPYVEANGLLSRIQSAVLGSRNGDGHTSYVLFGETYKAINQYLISAQAPPPNTVYDS